MTSDSPPQEGPSRGVDPSTIHSIEQFVEALSLLRGRSAMTFQMLSEKVGSSKTTINGWFKGHHLPHTRDNPIFGQVLVLLGVDNGDLDAWMDVLTRLRPNRTLTRPENPYQGLNPFTEDKSALFFGREDLIISLADRVAETAESQSVVPLVVLGPSGCGKSSLLHAGLVPRLKAVAGAHVTYLGPDSVEDADSIIDAARSAIRLASAGRASSTGCCTVPAMMVGLCARINNRWRSSGCQFGRALSVINAR